MTDLQTLFNRVWERLTLQGKGSFEQETPEHPALCLYRSPDGSKCAVGILMADEEYQETFEGGDGEITTIIQACPSLQEYEVSDLLRMQKIHDDAVTDSGDGIASPSFLVAFHKRMREFAQENNLTCPS